MLNHTKKIKEMYEDVQKKLFYIIPEKWESLYLYASIIENKTSEMSGELFFYYIPKGILKKKPVNVYEIPFKFNLNEKEYLKLIDILFGKIKAIREEFITIGLVPTWTNLTMIIKGTKFKVEYDYEDLSKSNFNNYERHIIWRYKYLDVNEQQMTKEEKQIIKRYLNGPKMLTRKEIYESGIYVKNIKNIVDFDTESYQENQNIEYITSEKKEIKNQILVSRLKHNN